MITDYLNQSATYETFKSTDLYGTPTYNPAVTIRVRKRKTSSSAITGHGEVVDIKNVLHTDSVVSVGDKVDGCVVQAIEELVNYAGIVIGTVMYT